MNPHPSERPLGMAAQFAGGAIFLAAYALYTSALWLPIGIAFSAAAGWSGILSVGWLQQWYEGRRIHAEVARRIETYRSR